jgi:excisionase family DNA binding protein
VSNDKLAAERVSFYTVAETAALLRVDAATIYRAIREDDFPAIRVRPHYVIPAAAVEQLAMRAAQTPMCMTNDGQQDLTDSPEFRARATEIMRRNTLAIRRITSPSPPSMSRHLTPIRTGHQRLRTSPRSCIACLVPLQWLAAHNLS